MHPRIEQAFGRLRGWLCHKVQPAGDSALSKIRKMSAEEARAAVGSYIWWHSIDLGGGVTTPGRKTPHTMTTEFENTFAKINLKNKSVLDIGASNGGFAVEAMRRGARRVVALDHHQWNDKEWRGRETFELVRRATATDIEALDINLDQPYLRLSHLGHFDVVLFLGVFYHLLNPIGAFREIVPLVREILIVETHIEHTSDPRPLMVFFPGVELAGDVSNWWGPNTSLMTELLRAAGFVRIEVSAGSDPNRQIFHAYRTA
jgi:tRNA (mo5U34)-methyltransferase